MNVEEITSDVPANRETDCGDTGAKPGAIRRPWFLVLNRWSLLVYFAVYLYYTPIILIPRSIAGPQPYEIFSFLTLQSPILLYDLIRWLTYYRLRIEAKAFIEVSFFFEIILIIGLPVITVIFPPKYGVRYFLSRFWNESFVNMYDWLGIPVFLLLVLFMPIWCFYSMGKPYDDAGERKARTFVKIYLAALTVYIFTCIIVINDIL